MIGIFDSGSGGLSVVGPLRRLAPHADIVYFADLAHVPYGDKSTQEIDCLTYAGMQTVLRYGATQIVNACNTSSTALVLGRIDRSQIGGEEIIDMIGPTLEALRKENYKKIAVIATHATVRSEVYQRGLQLLGIDSIGIPAPELVLAIEQGSSEVTKRAIVRDAVARAIRGGCDGMILGCTHFPLVAHLFEEELGSTTSVTIIDPSVFVAREAVARFNTDGKGKTVCVLSRDSSIFRKRVLQISDGLSVEFIVVGDVQ